VRPNWRRRHRRCRSAGAALGEGVPVEAVAEYEREEADRTALADEEAARRSAEARTTRDREFAAELLRSIGRAPDGDVAPAETPEAALRRQADEEFGRSLLDEIQSRRR
jgi:hypothetical protein